MRNHRKHQPPLATIQNNNQEADRKSAFFVPLKSRAYAPSDIPRIYCVRKIATSILGGAIMRPKKQPQMVTIVEIKTTIKHEDKSFLRFVYEAIEKLREAESENEKEQVS